MQQKKSLEQQNGRPTTILNIQSVIVLLVYCEFWQSCK